MSGQAEPPQAVMARAYEQLQAGALDEAERLVRDLLESLPNFPPALHLLGHVLHGRGQVDEAIKSIRDALVFAPRDLEARMNLGIFLMDQGRPDEAKAEFRFVVEVDPGIVAAHGNLATIYEEQGAFAEAEAQISFVLEADRNDTSALRLLARVQRRTKQFEAEVQTAKRLIELEPNDRTLQDALSRAYFLWFDCVDRDPDAAKKVLAEWIAFAPRDPVAKHMFAAHGGASAPSRASNEYVQFHFDEFAATFDQVLAALEYRAPSLIRAAVERSFPTRTRSLVIADLGCGTGVLGPLLKPWAKTLVGVDLSQGMLDRSRALNVYDELVKDDLASFLSKRNASFDVVVAGDTLVYVGDLDETLKALTSSLRQGGVFVATFEELPEDETKRGYVLNRAGRYAHKRSHLSKRFAAASLKERSLERIEIRLELGKPVGGLLAVVENTNDEFG